MGKLALCRREVLLPGDLLPEAHRCAGKHHGVVLRVAAPQGAALHPTAVIQMTDFTDGGRSKKLKVVLPVDQVLPFVVPKAGSRRVKKKEEVVTAERLLGINYDIERWPSLDRERAPKKAKRSPDDPPLHGPQLHERLRELEESATTGSDRFPPGTRVWVRVAGSGLWPGVAWAFGLCKRRDFGQLLVSHRPGLMLVRFYGEHSNMWVRPEDCDLPPADEGEHMRQLRAAGRQHNKLRLLELAMNELEGAHSDPELERRRMVHLYEQYTQARQALDNCYLCRELGADLECCHCDRLFHPICLRDPAVAAAELPGHVWSCPCCGEEQQVGEVREEEEGGDVGCDKVERMGLTPDWIIEAAAFRVFGLRRPTAAEPYIQGLLDPCTNSKLAPNIPAEKLYDKQDNGLKLSNSWEGHFVLLNPDYAAQVQWRFVNRAIDEVENGQVPAVVLVCRNSTDTGYFQRLRPYPRVLLRRMSARFKDYDKTPIGFGIAVFCIAKTNARKLYSRFYDAFEGMGEPNIPVDKTMMQSGEFYSLLDRLRHYAAQHHRDHWVQCTCCGKWRIVDFQQVQQVGDDTEWSCRMLRPPFTSCQTPLSKGEQVGGHYAAGGADWAVPGDEGGDCPPTGFPADCSGGSGGGGGEGSGGGSTGILGEGLYEVAELAAGGQQEQQEQAQQQPHPAMTAAAGAAAAAGGAGTSSGPPLSAVQTPAAGAGVLRAPWSESPPSGGGGGSGSDVGTASAAAAAVAAEAAEAAEAEVTVSVAMPSPRPAAMLGSSGSGSGSGSAAAVDYACGGAAGVAPPRGQMVTGPLPPAFQPAFQRLPPPSPPPQQQAQQQQGQPPLPGAVPAGESANPPDAVQQQPGAGQQLGELLRAQQQQQQQLARYAQLFQQQLSQQQRQQAAPAPFAAAFAAVAAPAAAPGDKQQLVALPPLLRLPSPLAPASQVVCSSTLAELVRLPSRNISLDSEEGGGGQVLTALELARQARIAANRAYLAGLGLGPKAMHAGQIAPLAPNDPVMLAAARELATRAAAEQGRQQLEEVRRRYEAARRRRQREEPQLLVALKELQGDEAAALQQLERAERAAAALQQGHPQAVVAAAAAELAPLPGGQPAAPPAFLAPG